MISQKQLDKALNEPVFLHIGKENELEITAREVVYEAFSSMFKEEDSIKSEIIDACLSEIVATIAASGMPDFSNLEKALTDKVLLALSELSREYSGSGHG